MTQKCMDYSYNRECYSNLIMLIKNWNLIRNSNKNKNNKWIIIAKFYSENKFNFEATVTIDVFIKINL